MPARRFELHTSKPPGKLHILYGRKGEKPKVLYVSRNLGKRNAPIYYVRFKDDRVVFRIDSTSIDALLGGLERRP